MGALADGGGEREAGPVRPGTTLVLAILLTAIFLAAIIQFVFLGKI
jgi:hypothetical protein